MSKHHVLKIKKSFYEAKVAGDKMFEIRVDDRDFEVGDTVSYETVQDGYWWPAEGKWEITFISTFEQKNNFVVFGEKEYVEKKLTC